MHARISVLITLLKIIASRLMQIFSALILILGNSKYSFKLLTQISTMSPLNVCLRLPRLTFHRGLLLLCSLFTSNLYLSWVLSLPVQKWFKAHLPQFMMSLLYFSFSQLWCPVHFFILSSANVSVLSSQNYQHWASWWFISFLYWFHRALIFFQFIKFNLKKQHSVITRNTRLEVSHSKSLKFKSLSAIY